MKFNKNALFHQISSVPIFAMFLVMFFSWIFWWRCFFILFGRDFSSDGFLQRCFFNLFGREMSLETDVLVEIVLQFFFLQGTSLQSFLGRIFRDNFW